MWGPRGPGGVSGHWKATSKEFCVFSSIMSIDTNLSICVGRDFNKVLPSGLIIEEWTR